jgi:hypothetical protein
MGIVVLTQMAQEQVAESRMPETLYGAGTFVIAEVTASLHNPHLEFICIWSAHKHIHIVI